MYYICFFLPFHNAYILAGIRADTPESEKDPERHPSPPSDPPERSPEPVDQGRQRAVAAVQAMHPPSFQCLVWSIEASFHHVSPTRWPGRSS